MANNVSLAPRPLSDLQDRWVIDVLFEQGPDREITFYVQFNGGVYLKLGQGWEVGTPPPPTSPDVLQS